MGNLPLERRKTARASAGSRWKVLAAECHTLHLKTYPLGSLNPINYIVSHYLERMRSQRQALAWGRSANEEAARTTQWHVCISQASTTERISGFDARIST